jgi:hypothetical protein
VHDPPLPFDLPAVQRKKLTIDFAGGNQSSDAGILLLREAERKIGLCQRLAAVRWAMAGWPMRFIASPNMRPTNSSRISSAAKTAVVWSATFIPAVYGFGSTRK